MLKVLILFLSLVIISSLIYENVLAAIYLGTCEGYVFFQNGSLASGANVTVSVEDCSGSHCYGSVLTDSGGYYVLANLDLNAGESVNVEAYHSASSSSGTASGVADNFQSAFVNITSCRSPSTPVLILQNNTHQTSVNLSWISGVDPDALPVHDRYQLDENIVVDPADSPQYESGLTYSTHTWRVQTCNAGCCSNWAEDDFTVYNNPPSSPNLTDQTDTLSNNVTLSWVGGTDPDGDAFYDEYKFHNEPLKSNLSSPQTETGLAYSSYTWKVRTCDVLGACSTWSTDSFSVVNNPCPAPILVNQPDTHNTSINFEWFSNSTDIDGDSCHDRFQLDSQSVIDPAVSPVNKTALSYAVHTWRVQSCDDKGACSAWTEDTFSIGNSAPSQPNLTNQTHIDGTSATLEWTSGTDPENDTTYDQFQLDDNNITNSTSPQEVSFSGVEYHTWRVRTCDILGACSAWAEDTFIGYQCPSVGGGGGGIRVITDEGVCPTCPICSPCKPKKIFLSKINLDLIGIGAVQVGVGEEALIEHNLNQYLVYVQKVDAENGRVYLKINNTEIILGVGEKAVPFDIDNDGFEETEVFLQMIKDQEAQLIFSLAHREGKGEEVEKAKEKPITGYIKEVVKVSEKRELALIIISILSAIAIILLMCLNHLWRIKKK